MNKSIILYSNQKIPLEIPTERLHLDGLNPRLPENEMERNEEEILYTLISRFDLEDLAESMSNNGYFDEEPMIAAPINLPPKFKRIKKDSKSWNEYVEYLKKPTTIFIVIEGNRRLATIKLLLNNSLRKKYNLDWEKISKEVEKDLRKITTIVYPTREGVLPYMGVRHIAGIRKWEPYAKARYIDYMIKKEKSIVEIKRMIGETNTREVEKLYLAYRLIQIMQGESEEVANKAKYDNFTYIIVAVSLEKIKKDLGIPRKWKEVNFKNPITKSKIKNLVILFSLLFGDEKSPSPVISDSRNVKQIADILENKEAKNCLISTRNVQLALQVIKGEETSIIDYLKNAQRSLRTVLGMIPNNKTNRVKEEIKKCKDILEDIFRILGN